MEALNLQGLADTISKKSEMLRAEAVAGNTSALILALAMGILVCFLGLKIVKILGAFIGMILGAAIGGAVCIGFGITSWTALIVVVGGALLVGALAFFLYQFGVFLTVLCYVGGICVSLLNPSGILLSIVCLVIAIVCAVLSVIYIEPMVIVITAISGGLSAGMSAASLLDMTASIWVGIGISAVLAVAGMVVQFVLHSKKVGKKERVHARKHREEESRESEVEKARLILDEEEPEDDEEDDELDDVQDDVQDEVQDDVQE